MSSIPTWNGPLTRYAELRVAHAPGMPGTFSPLPRVSDPDMHHGTCVTHVPWCMPGSLTSGFLWSQWRGKRSRHSRRMRNPQFSYLVRGPYRSILYLNYAMVHMGTLFLLAPVLLTTQKLRDSLIYHKGKKQKYWRYFQLATWYTQ